MKYLFFVLILSINIILQILDGFSMNFSILLNLFNVMTYPILFMFMTIGTIISKPPSSYLKFVMTNEKNVSKKDRVLAELLRIIKDPIILAIFVFPFLLPLIKLKLNFNDAAIVVVHIAFNVFLMLNLLIISIIIKNDKLKNGFSTFIIILGVIFSIYNSNIIDGHINSLWLSIGLNILSYTFLVVYSLIHYSRSFRSV